MEKGGPADDAAALPFVNPVAMAALQEQLSGPRGDLEAEVAALDEDAPDEERQRPAERMAPDLQQQRKDHRGLADPGILLAPGNGGCRVGCR